MLATQGHREARGVRGDVGVGCAHDAAIPVDSAAMELRIHEAWEAKEGEHGVFDPA